jgi:hypothetical protein
MNSAAKGLSKKVFSSYYLFILLCDVSLICSKWSCLISFFFGSLKPRNAATIRYHSVVIFFFWKVSEWRLEAIQVSTSPISAHCLTAKCAFCWASDTKVALLVFLFHQLLWGCLLTRHSQNHTQKRSTRTCSMWDNKWTCCHYGETWYFVWVCCPKMLAACRQMDT